MTMAIPKHMRDRFETMKRAAANDCLALMSCECVTTGEPRFVICAVNVTTDGYDFVPLAHMTPNDNPYDAYVPPAQGDE